MTRLLNRRGFATFIVLWVTGIAAILVIDLQSSAFGQAMAGRESLARVRAHWAARAGIEASIAMLGFNTENPDETDAFTIEDDLEAVAEGRLAGAEYIIRTSGEQDDILGPADPHARLNVNKISTESLMLLTYMTEDVADSILDWVDEDDDSRPLGAEIGYYATFRYPYEPRNGPMRSLLELELVAGVPPEYVRGEDWNLNGVLDPNENDGDASWPEDNADGVLDRGWSEFLTAESIDGGSLGHSGETRIDLSASATNDIMSLLNVDLAQAEAIVNYSATPDASLADFIRTDLNTLGTQAGGNPRGPPVAALNTDQLAVLLAQCSIGQTSAAPGKLNVNTCSDELFDYIAEISATVADAIIFDRGARAEGYTSIADLLTIPSISRNDVADLYEIMDVRSNTYVVTSRGRDAATGLEVEIIATLDRSSLPIVIREIRIR